MSNKTQFLKFFEIKQMKSDEFTRLLQDLSQSGDLLLTAKAVEALEGYIENNYMNVDGWEDLPDYLVDQINDALGDSEEEGYENGRRASDDDLEEKIDDLKEELKNAFAEIERLKGNGNE